MKIYILIPLIILFCSCNTKKIDIETEKLNVKNTDIEFSNLSKKEGMIKAFLSYADSGAVMLRDNSMPVIGKENVGKLYTGRTDTGFVLTWAPLDVFVSSSKDLAYTFGIYTLDSKNDTLRSEGTYCTIWKKQSDGTWKWILDTGNDGLK